MMFTKRNLWIVIFFTLSSLFVKEAQSNIDYNANCKKAYEFALAFHFDTMDSVLQTEKLQHPNNSVIESIKCAASFLKYISSNNKRYLNEFDNNYKIAIDKIEDESDKNAYKLYILTDLHLYSAFINSINSNFITALIHFKKAYNLIYENNSRFPQFSPNNKALGVMNIAVGSIPKSYNWVLDLLNLKGDLKLGNKQLEEFMNTCKLETNYKYLFLESVVLYSFTHSNYSNIKDQVNCLSSIFSDPKINMQYIDNQMYAFIKTSYYQHLKQNDNALKALAQIQNDFKSNPHKLYYLDYMYGESLLFKNDTLSRYYFARYINKYSGENYLKAATYKIAWSYLLEKNIKAYNDEMHDILNIGDDFFDSDKQAQKAAKNGEIPNISLLKSRLLFDGGYYRKADSVLRNSYAQGVINSQHDNLEYIYRLARIYDELNDFKVSEIYYKMTIEKGKNYKYYFAANSALNLGYYYEQEKQFTEAKKMYQLCLDLEFDEYQNSITQKAKAGLNRIEDEEE